MGGYIGAKTGTLVASASDIRGDISATDTTPEITLKNTTETDADGTRSGKITFKGEQSGGEESVLAQIQGSHDGTADDEKGDLIFKTNDGNDGSSPTEAMRINSDQNISIPDNGKVMFGTGDDLQIYHDATNSIISNATGDLTLDVAGNITLDADGGNVRFKDDGTEYGTINKNSTANLSIYSSTSDADMLFQGNDGGSVITALTLDMSEAGNAHFNQHAYFVDNGKAIFGGGSDLQVYHNGTNSIIDSNTGNLEITSDAFYVNNAANNEVLIKALNGDAVSLYYNNSKKFETTSTGALISGTNPSFYVQGDGSSYYPYIRVTGLNGGLALGTYFGGNISGNTVSFRTGANTQDGGTERFRIAANGDLTATDTSISSNSDERLKENIADYSYDIAKFKQFEPKTFDWKNPEAHNGRSGNRGFIAQAVKAIDDKWVGEANVTEENPDYDIISDNVSLTSKLGEKDAMYISIIQQLITKIETLETQNTTQATQIADLITRVTALEAE